MPSQEEYLDNLLKGIETENTETEVTKEPKMTGTEEETAKAPETPEPVEESGTQVDMSDMDDLLQSALDAQKADSSEQETEASQPVAENTAILPEETASMSEDEINRLLQQSQEQSGDAPAQESNDANDDLIKMLENADDEGLSNILDQVTPETAQPEETAEREEDNGKRGKKKKEKKKITLREYHKKRMFTGIAILVTEIFENTAEHYKLDNTTWATVIFVVLAAMTALFAVIWLYASCQKVDKEDEMAKENMLKAHQSITKMFLIILAVAIFISMFWDGSITIKINSDRLYQVWFIFWFSYMTLESGFFLHHEGKLNVDEEDE